MIVPNKDDSHLESIPTGTSLSSVSLRSYNVFPNLVSPISEEFFPILLFWPNGTHRSKLEFLWLGRDRGAGSYPEHWEEVIRQFDVILREDMQFGEAIQKSLKARAFRGVPLSYQEERIYYWHQ